MYSLEKYTQDSITLAKSLVIKSIDVAIAINKGLLLTGQLRKIPSDKREWKYFMNLAGIRHSTNQEVMVTVLELGERHPLSKELLDTYLYTRSELLKNGEVYENLLLNYPKDITFINGCLYPVDIEKAIKAEDGTILNYNKNFVEPSEYNLIKELEYFVKSFLSRWYVREYTITDELYLPALMGVLYAHLPSEIMNLRLEKVHTNEAHSFHLEHYFRSKLNIWDEITVVNDKTKYWLYKNLQHIINNIGTQKAFDSVIKNILNNNGVGIGEYVIRKPNNEPNTEQGLLQPTYKTSKIVMNSSKLNPYFTDNSKGVIDIETIVNKELNLENVELSEESKQHNNFLSNDVQRIIKNTNRDMQKTKVLEISTYELFKRQGVDLFKLILDQMLFSTKNNKIQYLVEFIDPNSNKNYILNSETGILFIIKLLLKLTNQEDMKLTKLYYDTVMFPDRTVFDKAYEKVFQDGYINVLFNDLKENFPNIQKQCTTNLDMTMIIEDVKNFYSYIWTLDANSESSIVSANFKLIMNLITQKGEYILTDDPEGKTIDELLEEHDMMYEITDTFDLQLSFSELIKLFTNIDINEYNIIKQISLGFRNLVNKLTSYSTQVLMSNTGENTLYVYYNNLNIFRSKLGIANITDGNTRPLEEQFVLIESMANNFSDDCKNIQGLNINVKSFTAPEWPIIGHCYIAPNITQVSLNPSFAVEIYDLDRMGINRCTYENKFILGVDADMEPTIETDIKLTTAGNTMPSVPDIATGFSNPISIEAQMGGLPEQPVVGTMEFKTRKDDIINLRPTFGAQIKEDPVVPPSKGEYKQQFLLNVDISSDPNVDHSVTMTSGANVNDENDIQHGQAFGNPITIESQSAKELDHPVTIVNDTKINKDITITSPTVGVEVVSDPKVSVTKVNYTQEFIQGVDVDMETIEDKTIVVDGSSNLITDKQSEQDVLVESYINPVANIEDINEGPVTDLDVITEGLLSTPSVTVSIKDKNDEDEKI